MLGTGRCPLPPLALGGWPPHRKDAGQGSSEPMLQGCGRGGDGTTKEAAEAQTRAAARARGHLRLWRGDGVGVLHPCSKADNAGGGGGEPRRLAQTRRWPVEAGRPRARPGRERPWPGACAGGEVTTQEGAATTLATAERAGMESSAVGGGGRGPRRRAPSRCSWRCGHAMRGGGRVRQRGSGVARTINQDGPSIEIFT